MPSAYRAVITLAMFRQVASTYRGYVEPQNLVVVHFESEEFLRAAQHRGRIGGMVVIERFPDETDPTRSPFSPGALYRVRRAFRHGQAEFHAGEVLTYVNGLWSRYDCATRFVFRDDLGNFRNWWLSDDAHQDDWRELFELVATMPRDNEHNPDPNANAFRIVGETIEAEADDLRRTSDNPQIEAAWQAWSGCIQNVDARTRTLLRAAFEAGWESGRR